MHKWSLKKGGGRQNEVLPRSGKGLEPALSVHPGPATSKSASSGLVELSHHILHSHIAVGSPVHQGLVTST